MERGSEPLDADEWARTDDVEQLRHEQYPRSATDSAVTESEYREYVRKGAAGELPYHRGREGEVYAEGCDT